MKLDLSKNPRTFSLILAAIIFLLAFSVRVLTWHDTRLEVGKVQTQVTADYQRVARLLSDGGLKSFFSSISPLADPNNLGHPPGYSFLLALIYRAFGQSDSAVQFVQIICDALSAVLIFLIVAELFSLAAGGMAGALAVFSPQLAWNSVLLLPDSISVLPILIAIYLLVRAIRQPRLWMFLIIGGLIAVSCWFRANTMLLTFFVALAVLFFFRRAETSTPGKLKVVLPGWRFALAVVCGTLLIILPLTIRNAIVFHRFIPLSLGAGQTFLEGISDYDPQGRFGIPRTDMGIMKQEAEMYHRPDYFGTLFNPDGVERERARLSRGLAIVRSHPFWFAGVMARRASSMMRLERSRLVSRQPAITHTPRPTQPTSVVNADELMTRNLQLSPGAKLAVTVDGQDVNLNGDASRYGAQLAWPITVRPNMDYVIQVPMRIEQGRMRLSVVDPNGAVLSTGVAETIEDIMPSAQPITLVKLSFVADDEHPRLVVSNEASANPVAHVGPLEIYELGPARFLWTRYPRLVIHAIQKLFITAVMLPAAILGLLLLILKKKSAALVILSVAPIYFFTVQSAFHTEYRYVLAVNYFSFALVGVGIALIGNLIRKNIPFHSPSVRKSG